MNTHKLIAWMGIAALVVAGLVASSTMAAANLPDSEIVAKLLSEAKTMAFQLKEDAATMETFTRSDLNWESHAIAITQVKEHVNALERQNQKLKDARNMASPSQKIAINRITPFLDELEGYTEAVIEHLNKNPRLVNTAEYKDYLEANADYSADLAAMVGNFVDYGRTKERLDRLTDKLELPRR
jgi:hypothetical protein